MDASDQPSHARAMPGNNNPPEEPKSALELAREGFGVVSKALEDIPVVQTEDESLRMKAQIDLLKGYADGMETERDGKVRPLNTTVAGINADYKKVSEPIKKLREIALDRLTAFALAEEKRREAIAEAARQEAIAAEKAARAAEALEKEAVENAEAGECVDVGAVVAKADEAFSEYGFAARTATRAEKATHVKIGAAPGARALSIRTKEELRIDDAKKALAAILKAGDGGLPDKLAEALLSAARDYRKLKSKLPDGISSHQVRSL